MDMMEIRLEGGEFALPVEIGASMEDKRNRGWWPATRRGEGPTRKCEKCGKEYTPTAKQRMYRNPVSTCPECLAAGKKARGERGDGKPTVCAVCGTKFNRERSDARRCPECVAARPTYSVEKHAAAYARTGER